MTSNEFTQQFLTTFKPEIIGQNKLTITSLGNLGKSGKYWCTVGNLPFIGTNNQGNISIAG